MSDSLRPTYGHKRNQSSLATSTLTREKSRTDESGLADLPVSTMSGNQAAGSVSPAETTRFPAGLSIDQSVRAFKIFELLRSGGNDNVKQAIDDNTSLQGTTVLHLAIQCANVLVVEQVLKSSLDVDAQDKDGNTALHLAATLGRLALVQPLLESKADTTVLNYQGQTALDLARTPQIFQLLQLDRAMFTETQIAKVHGVLGHNDYDGLEALLEDPRITAVLDVNALELATDPTTIESGGTLLHQAARNRDHRLIQLLLLNGADPFRRDKKGRLPKDVTKDDKTRAILKKSPAATAAQRGIQEKAILGGSIAGDKSMGRDSREIKGYLKKWTNYTSGYKLRWFVLEDGVLSYYKHQDDAGSACRGAMNMKIAKLTMDPTEKTRFEIGGKSSIKYHLKANHEVEAKRWFWALNNAIQWAKDEARQEEQRASKDADAQRQAISDQRARENAAPEGRASLTESRFGAKGLVPATAVNIPSSASKTSIRPSTQTGGSATGDEYSAAGSYSASVAAKEPAAISGDLDEEEDYGDDTSSREMRPASKDAFSITAQSADLQLEILHQVSQALHTEVTANPNTPISQPNIQQAISTYLTAVSSLKTMVGDLQRISRDRDAYWQYRLDRETDMRRMWEESMAKVVQDQEALEGKIGESEEKRKRTKRALREALEDTTKETNPIVDDGPDEAISRSKSFTMKRRATVITVADLSDSDSDLDEEEFFDAVGAGEVPVEDMPMSPMQNVETPKAEPGKQIEQDSMAVSFSGYEDPIRKRLTMDADDRPKISLWGILKSMIGKDMTKMTLPVSFNEPTSLLQRVAEDMEYTDLLDTAVERPDPTERMLYVAAFAASEYASTIGRVAKPFNPLLGETYEYARPDKGFRFFVEQVSHHPPIGAAWAESKKWTYYGESAVKSQFYGRSFDINPLGTWFLRIKPSTGGEELYTWKKVTTSVVGIMTGSPAVDNYGTMEIKNWTTGEVCTLDFKARGWKASSAYQVLGKVIDADGRTRWSLGGRWNDKIFARLTPGYEANNLEAVTGSDKAFLVWQAHARPSGIPFNLTPFGVTLNAIPDRLRPWLPQTDTRLRPDQRAMEDGQYDLAASEKNRLEEKQRARRRIREAAGQIHQPRWFKKSRCEITGEEYWATDGSYWQMRASAVKGGKWDGLDDIFSDEPVDT